MEEQQLFKALVPCGLGRPEHHPHPLQPPPPVVRQRALPPLVRLLLQPGVEAWVALLRPGRTLHAAVAVLRVESCQLAKVGGP